LLRSTDLECRRGEAGFTLIEALVALAVVAVSLAAIGTLFAANIRSTRALENRLTMAETARTVMTALPDRAQLALDGLSGDIGGHRWRFDVLPFVANFVDLRRPTPWTPQTVVVRVQAPSGPVMRIDTVRLRRTPGYKK